MYACYTCEVTGDFYFTYPNYFIFNVNFTMSHEIDLVLRVVRKFGVDTIKEMFDSIEIRYKKILESGTMYYVDDTTLLPISALSSGERLLLFAMLKKKLEESICIIGILGRLDKKHREILEHHFADYNKLVLLQHESDDISHNFHVTYYKPFEEIIKEGVFDL